MLELPKSRGSHIPNYSLHVLASYFVKVMKFKISLRDTKSHELYHFVMGWDRVWILSKFINIMIFFIITCGIVTRVFDFMNGIIPWKANVTAVISSWNWQNLSFDGEGRGVKVKQFHQSYGFPPFHAKLEALAHRFYEFHHFYRDVISAYSWILSIHGTIQLSLSFLLIFISS